MAEPDSGLVNRIGHDPDALEVLYRAYVDQVFRFVTRRVRDPHDVTDLTADVFLAAMESAAGYRPRRGRPLMWLIGIARNTVNNWYRRQALQQRVESEFAAWRLLDGNDVARLEEQIDAAGQARDLYQRMHRLSESQRAVLELVAVDGLTVAETAEVLGISAVTARVRLSRARKALLSNSDTTPESLAREV